MDCLVFYTYRNRLENLGLVSSLYIGYNKIITTSLSGVICHLLPLNITSASGIVDGKVYGKSGFFAVCLFFMRFIGGIGNNIAIPSVLVLSSFI